MNANGRQWGGKEAMLSWEFRRSLKQLLLMRVDSRSFAVPRLGHRSPRVFTYHTLRIFFLELRKDSRASIWYTESSLLAKAFGVRVLATFCRSCFELRDSDFDIAFLEWRY